MMIRNPLPTIMRSVGTTNRCFTTITSKFPSLKETGFTSEQIDSGDIMKIRPLGKSIVESQTSNSNHAMLETEAVKKVIDQLPNAPLKEQKQFLYDHLLKNMNLTVVSGNKAP